MRTRRLLAASLVATALTAALTTTTAGPSLAENAPRAHGGVPLEAQARRLDRTADRLDRRLGYDLRHLEESSLARRDAVAVARHLRADRAALSDVRRDLAAVRDRRGLRAARAALHRYRPATYSRAVSLLARAAQAQEQLTDAEADARAEGDEDLLARLDEVATDLDDARSATRALTARTAARRVARARAAMSDALADLDLVLLSGPASSRVPHPPILPAHRPPGESS